MNKKFLIIQLRPEDETSDDEFAAFLRVGGLREAKVERLRMEQVSLPDINFDDYAAIIVGGSPFDISTPEEGKSALQKRIESDFTKLFDRVVAEDFPFLGACSGSGLLGSYLGTTVSGKYPEPISGVDVTVTQEGIKDPLLAGLPRTFRALVGHKEACDVTPPGAVLLASSPTCPVQMFRVGRNVYATQFHPEADASVFTVRINVYKHHGYFKPEDAQDLIDVVKNEDTPEPKKILQRFVARYGER